MKSKAIDIQIIDNSKLFSDELKHKIPRALEAMGITAERHAKERAPVDTGRLRNSLTHATSDYLGQASYKDTSGKVYHDGAAKSQPKESIVVIGTNVEYAPYIEMGTSKQKAQPYLKPALTDHVNEYKRLVKKYLEE